MSCKRKLADDALPRSGERLKNLVNPICGYQEYLWCQCRLWWIWIYPQ